MPSGGECAGGEDRQFHGADRGRWLDAHLLFAARFAAHRFRASMCSTAKSIRQLLRDKLVLVGVTGLALTDYQNTPLGEAMPGSEIHAQLLENLKDQTWLQRSRWAPPLEVAVFVLFGLLLIWATPRWTPAQRGAAGYCLHCRDGVRVVCGISCAAAIVRRGDARPWAAAPVQHAAGADADGGRASRRKALERVVQAQREAAAVVAGEMLGGTTHPDRNSASCRIAARRTPRRPGGHR